MGKEFRETYTTKITIKALIQYYIPLTTHYN